MKTLLFYLNIFWQADILGKEFVLNNKNGKIHHYTCEWCDNITDYKRLTQDKAIELLNNHSLFYKLPSCCIDKIKL